MTALHGTALGIALTEQEPLQGLLLCGPPGSGKSALAAELIAHCPYRRTALIADDLVRLDSDGRALLGELGPLLHLRGLGIARVRGCEALSIRWAVSVGAPAPELPEASVIEVPAFPAAAALRLQLSSLASGESLWCGFEPGPSNHGASS
ncbi:hypothetical protein [Parvularcula maris]|uniref:HPr kinase/phosphorylase C-terminal domain-containing protein n=1 Tax=Parvularcula maris TaxID=2965077 RepID=A0A9X2LD02_9PROT|nr:hypothetical protein [Parvularcula maris]MCQ8186262.1 hypothetical protein [Parvularcula maris]